MMKYRKGLGKLSFRYLKEARKGFPCFHSLRIDERLKYSASSYVTEV